MVVGWVNWPYTTLKALWDEWTPDILPLMGDGLEGNGIADALHNAGPVVVGWWAGIPLCLCSGNVVTNSITQNGGLRGGTDGVVRRYIIENECWMGGPAVYHPECIAGEVYRGPNDWCKHWRWASLHWDGDGCVVGGDSTLIMQWKCAVQVYNNELFLEWCASYVPILLNGTELLIDDALWAGGNATLYDWERGCRSELMGDGREKAGMDGQMIGLRNGDIVHNSGVINGMAESCNIVNGFWMGGPGFIILNDLWS
ncbi:hypothetical protein T12_15094 [Trichinella patagoniensis]|uniref:Uncharacterized protein n=1 Tax=Trichinella patagoniensis TaxID=990121 RepID=A0A0V0ZGR2_9BILA|nr:hypothetical protein T12_15094 [Trichinella patagoniensis]